MSSAVVDHEDGYQQSVLPGCVYGGFVRVRRGRNTEVCVSGLYLADVLEVEVPLVLRPLTRSSVTPDDTRQSAIS